MCIMGWFYIEFWLVKILFYYVKFMCCIIYGLLIGLNRELNVVCICVVISKCVVKNRGEFMSGLL